VPGGSNTGIGVRQLFFLDAFVTPRSTMQHSVFMLSNESVPIPMLADPEIQHTSLSHVLLNMVGRLGLQFTVRLYTICWQSGHFRWFGAALNNAAHPIRVQ